jgi:fatty-acyl-CoA synthase
MSVVDPPASATVRRPPLAHPSDRRRELDAQFTPWRSRTLGQHIDDCVVRFGDEPFVITDDRVWSYRDLRDWSRRLAAGLVALGVGTGDHVAVVMANYPEFVAVKFAIASVGAVSVPVNFLLRERELTYVLQQSDAVLLITMDSFRGINYVEILDSMIPGWERTRQADQFPRLRDVIVFSPNSDVRNWRSFDDLASLGSDKDAAAVDALINEGDPLMNSDILYTSGTTGTPKGVMLTHDMVLRTGYASAHGRGLWRSHRVTFALPMYHVFGYVECLLAATFVGGAVVSRTTFDPADMLETIARHRVDELACVPAMTLPILAEARRAREAESPYDLDTLRIVYSSGAAAPRTIHAEIREVLGPDELVAGYGQTETTAAMTSNAPELGDEHLYTKQGRFRNAGAAGDVTLGGCLAVYTTIDPETGAELPRGARGELVVRGPAVTAGYYNKPEETAAAFTATGWLRTGDLGVVDDDDYVILGGRLKETYRCGGEMVMPAEVEMVLAECPGVAQAHVVGIAHERMGEVGCAVIVTDGSQRPDAAELVAHCTKNLARFKVPAHVVFMEASELPVTVTGRVQKFRLAELVVELLAATSRNGAASEALR